MYLWVCLYSPSFNIQKKQEQVKAAQYQKEAVLYQHHEALHAKNLYLLVLQ
jgi:cell fate (sporulation/competence/biofilm development) regulator YmcA (YheA/YmcA/DUF963 family)